MLLELNQVEKSYPPAGGSPAAVLKDVSLTVNTGDTLAIVGPSGSGKSTLLNLMGGLDRPTAGSVLLGGRDLAALTDAELARVRNCELGFVFQLHHLLPQCSVWENVLLPTLPGRILSSRHRSPERAGSDDPPEQRAERLLQQVGLSDRLNHRPGQLSGGERQRVAVARALINRPRLLLADEPTGALDHQTAASLISLLLELNRAHQVALVLVTHALDLAARMGRIYRLEGGTLIDATRPVAH
jgi:lipoprotein-releasing system ATP-binding protein